jgi:DtxR family Mn-dependent transcriptional regulator
MATPKKITSNIEDYLKAIYRIEEERGVVRVKEISLAMNVTYPSTSGILKKMEAMELVEHERYGYVKLTDEGRLNAERILVRKEKIENFFKSILRLPEDIASQDACKMEHAMSDQTAERLMRFLDFLGAESPLRNQFIDRFHNDLKQR